MEEQISNLAGALVQLEARRCRLFGESFSGSTGWDILLTIASVGGTIGRTDLEQRFSGNPVVFERWLTLLTDRGLVVEGALAPNSNGSQRGLTCHPTVIHLAGWAEEALAMHLLEVRDAMAKFADLVSPQTAGLSFAPD